MYRDGNKLVLQRKSCYCADGGNHPGFVLKPMPCQKCKGTGNGARGGKGSCRDCYGSGKTYSEKDLIVCPTCLGNWKDFELENTCDYLPRDIFLDIPVKVFRSEREATWNENWLGVCCLFTCCDYGDAYRRICDADLIAELHSIDHMSQLCRHFCIKRWLFCAWSVGLDTNGKAN
jgi:hypothetical protein